MKHTREQKRAESAATAQAVFEGFPDWDWFALAGYPATWATASIPGHRHPAEKSDAARGKRGLTTRPKYVILLLGSAPKKRLNAW